MKKNLNIFKKFLFVCFLIPALTFALSACGQSEEQPKTSENTEMKDNGNITTETAPNDKAELTITQLEVCFGDDGEPFILRLDDNDTARGLAKSVGTNQWRLPIYHYDDFENSDVMQYYDIPSSYDIPYYPQTIVSQKAGEVYYSEPNRIILFYKDAQVQGEYTKIGTFNYSDEFLSAVENNPILEGWGNKIVLIHSGDE